MIALKLDFIAGRFHATPWNRAVNEGDVEWPPSPWRILRAIVAGWFQVPAFDRARLMALCDLLADPPSYFLPPTTLGHTRHYMPQGSLKGGKLETTLVLDSFVKFDASDVTSAYVVWNNATLDDQQLTDLRQACSQIAYLGRAESWCDATVIESLPPLDRHYEVTLASRSSGTGPLVQRLAAGAGLRGSGLLRSIFETTAEMRQTRHRMPNGTVLLDYRFPENFGFAPSLWSAPSVAQPSLPRVERFLLEAVRPRGLRPSVTDTVRLAGLMRSAAMKHFSTLHSGSAAPTVLSGRDDGAPAKEHGHAFFLPRDLDRDGRIDHIDVWFPVGASPGVLRALHSIDQLWSAVPSGKYAMTYLGAAENDAATTWQSVTPFVPPRHLKRLMMRAGVDAERAWVREQVLREIQNHRVAEPAEVAIWDERPPLLKHRGGRRTRFDVFVQSRKPGSERGRVYGATLRFTRPQNGPISLGREAHFGLGQFAPIP